MGWRTLVPVAGAALGALVIALLFRRLGVANVTRQLRVVGVGFGWLLAAYLLANVVYALPLGILLPRGTRVGPLALVKSRLAAVAVNAATPFLGVGGEPVRLLWLRPEERHGGAAGLMIDRGAFLVASALFLVAGTIVAAWRLPLPRSLRIALYFVAAITLLLSLGLVSLQRRGLMLRPLARLAGRLARRHRAVIAARAAELDERLRSLHTGREARLAAAVALHFLGRCVAGLEVYAGARLLGIDPGVAGTLLLAALPLAVDFACAMVPSQIGFHEGVTALVAQALGFDPAAGVALACLQRLRQLVFVSAGFLLLALRRPKPAPAVPLPLAATTPETAV